MLRIQETIVVEGRDDMIRLQACFGQLPILYTRGYGLSKRTFELLDHAYKRTGLIVFTDPDHAGEKIRERLSNRYPKAKHAFLCREEALRSENVGIENASCESIRRALERCWTLGPAKEEFCSRDLLLNGLSACEGASQRRAKLGSKLGIGYANAKTFLLRMNTCGITRSDFEEALRDLS